MTDQSKMIEAFEARVRRREERREFLFTSARAGIAAASISLLASCGDDDDDLGAGTPPPPPPQGGSAVGDPEILNFALQLEYLEAQFYSYAATGAGLPQNLLGGQGTQGTAVATGARQVPFTDPEVRRYALEIAVDERAHVAFLRTALGGAAVAQPNIDISVGTGSAFSRAARAAGLITATQSFDPYASDENFLLGAFIFEDVGVTAYKGAAPLITNKTFLEASAGILAVEAYHAGLIRTTLYGKGIQAPTLRTAANSISDARDSLDGASDIDQGITTGNDANIVPTDANGLAFSRTPGQALNIVFLTATATNAGGFFPSGVNGVLNTSAAN